MSASENEPSARFTLDLPSVREFNDRTTLWLLEDPLNLRDLLRIHRPELVKNLDFERAERINRSFIPADLQKEECDLLFRVPFRSPVGAETKRAESEKTETPSLWIYLLLEHQSKPDALMTLRILSYMLELWDTQRREWEARNAPLAECRLTPVVPFLFYTGEANWNTPLKFRAMFDVPDGFEPFIPSWETLFLNLHRTPPATLTSVLSSIGWALRALQVEKSSYEEFERVLREAMQGLEGLSEEQHGQWVRAAWYLALLINHRRPEPEGEPLFGLLREQSRQSKFYEQKETEAMYTLANKFEDQGIEKGQQLSLRAVLEQILVKKFGTMPDGLSETIADADLDTLNGWVVAASVANTLAEVGITSTSKPA